MSKASMVIRIVFWSSLSVFKRGRAVARLTVVVRSSIVFTRSLSRVVSLSSLSSLQRCEYQKNPAKNARKRQSRTERFLWYFLNRHPRWVYAQHTCGWLSPSTRSISIITWGNPCSWTRSNLFSACGLTYGHLLRDDFASLSPIRPWISHYWSILKFKFIYILSYSYWKYNFIWL